MVHKLIACLKSFSSSGLYFTVIIKIKTFRERSIYKVELLDNSR